MKIICFYLPQFHPIPENDEWWGAGFTEWVNVAQSQPRFKAHYQPHIPADLGFYDLRLEETRIEQAKLAQKYGISGFCYYHYWFNGKLLLERPFNDVLASGKPDFPFCLCWANENWTRAWDGREDHILISQKYDDQDNYNHILWLINAFKDNRYIKIDNRPVFLIYRIDQIKNITQLIAQWRKTTQDFGFQDIYLCAVKNNFTELSDQQILSFGFDAIVDFQPNKNDYPEPHKLSGKFYKKIRKLVPKTIFDRFKNSLPVSYILNYGVMIEKLIKKVWPQNYIKFPCVFPSWDNSSRKKMATIIQNEDPEIYKKWLSYAIKCVQKYPKQEQLVFINAWNEWAEGCHLEPDKKMGHAFLVATKNILQKGQSNETSSN